MQKKYFIGFDIGGTKIRGVLVCDNRIIKKMFIKTPLSKQKFIKSFTHLLEQLKPKTREVLGVGIGVAGVVERQTVNFSPNIKYLSNFNFKEILPKYKKVKLDNDARTFLRGEYYLNKPSKAKRFMGITIGTGIGRAYGENGIVKNIKKFEYKESWESEYQQLRFHNSFLLAKFIVYNLERIIKQYKPDVIFWGGGVIKNKKGLFEATKQELKKIHPQIKIKNASNNDFTAAFGAVKLFS
jgi:predicted NBD/HSP70 family sugar kinase